MILTNNKFGGIIVKNETFEKNYDTFRSFLVKDAEYDGHIELPKLKTSKFIPEKLVSFSKAVSKSWLDFDSWVMFYEHDVKFERLWNNPKQYIERLKRFKGIISPDFSMYRNMPLVMQQWSAYKGRALAVWFQNNGIEIIPNVRFNDERTYDFCFDGIEKFKTVAISTHGCIKKREDREYFKKGLAEMVKRLSPRKIIVYGSVPESIFKPYTDLGIVIIPFESEFSKSRRQVIA